MMAIVLLTFGLEVVEQAGHLGTVSCRIVCRPSPLGREDAVGPSQSTNVATNDRGMANTKELPSNQVLVYGHKIQEIATEKDLTLQFVAEQANLSFELVTQLFESRDVVLPLHVGKRLASTMGVDLADLRCLPH